MKLPLIKDDGSIHVNRGDQLIITLNNDVNFSVGDKIKFSHLLQVRKQLFTIYYPVCLIFYCVLIFFSKH